MKTSISFIIALLISLSGFAQILNGFNYKAVIKDASGNLITGQTIDLRFTIYYTDPNQTNVYQEKHSPTSDDNGIIIVNIGQGSTIFGFFPSIDWNLGIYHLKTEIDLERDDSFIDMGDTDFKAVPFARLAYNALTANTAENVTGLEQITEENTDTGLTNTGWRLKGQGPANYGSIGQDAVDLSIDFGSFTTRGATGPRSTALGESSTASGRSSLAMGFGSNASGSFSTAIGTNVIAPSFAETALGRYNTQYTPANTNGPGAESWNPTDRLFVIGNGTITDNGNGTVSVTNKNALTVLKNGNIGLGTVTSPLEQLHLDGNIRLSNAIVSGFTNGNIVLGNTSDNTLVGLYGTEWGPSQTNSVTLGSSSFMWSEIWSVNPLNTSSDRRLKKDIEPLIYGLETIANLKPISYKWKIGNQDKRLGFIAQDVESVIPEIVTYNKNFDIGSEHKSPSNDFYSMSYTELIPVLVKALQEQQDIIEQQNEKIDSFESSVSDLLKRMEQLETNN